MRSSRLRNGLPAATAAVATALMLLKLTGCGGSDETDPGTKPPVENPDAGGGEGGPNGPLTIAPGPSRGSAIAISPDDTIVVAVNRDSGSVSVFKTTYPDDGSPATLAKTAEVPVGGEPWQVVVAPDGDTAYVVLRKDQKLVKVAGLKGTPAVAGTAVVGSEPTGVALTPGGTRAWVANWVDGTLTGVDTKTMEAKSTIDLNAALVATKLVGDVKPRPALAHPRSIAITNNGDQNEDDESIYVTEYFAQRTEAEADNGANADVAKSGLVYKVKLSDKSVSAIKLAPIADIGFKDSAGGQAGCYPNQLQSITIQDKFAYVSSICASPKGPIGAVTTVDPPNLANIKTTTHGVVSVIDLSSDKEVPASTASLHQRFEAEFTKRALADDGTRRYPAVPSDIGFVKGGGVGYVVSNGADSVFRVQYDLTQASRIAEVGAANNAFINLNPAGIPAEKSGQNPIGIATANLDAHKRFAFVVNDVSRNVTVIDFNTQAVAGGAATPVVEQAAAMPAAGSLEESVRKGKRFFNTATGRWSLKGQGWNGCQSCHMDGLSDNVTWFFARGPRQSTSLDGSFSKKDPSDQRIFNWTAIFDEVADFEGNTRGISGGVGAIVSDKAPDVANRITNASHAGLSGSSEQLADVQNPLGLGAPSVLEDWENIKAWVQQVRPPRRPSNLDGAKIAAGKTLFVSDGSCTGCHSGDKWTISTRFYAANLANTDSLLTATWDPPPAGFPTALLPASDPASRFMRFNNGNPAALDQIQCILRPVGTFGKADAVMGQVVERRQDMTTPAQGDQANGNGYNPPSLLGVQVGAPYLHAGGAATLESLFSPTFVQHYGTLAPNFLKESDPTERAAKVEQLVHYLLSIDTEAPTNAIPTAGAAGGDFCKL
ncbi:MAG: YncE family protein [Deltaproteobacteria bacterium]|nr:YncE family protein [Deltaproteobacteria bacterium]